MQDTLNDPVCDVPSHRVIQELIDKNCTDYRYEIAPHPTKELRNRKEDNVCVGRS